MKTRTVSIFIILHISLMLCMSELLANTIIPAEGRRVGGMENLIGAYAAITNGKVAGSWEELVQMGDNLADDRSPFAVGMKISEEYAFVSPEQGAKFPDGTLILIRANPLPYPSAWKTDHSDIDPATLTPDQLESYRRAIAAVQQADRPIRYLIYKTPQGQVTSMWWYEDKVQAMLQETGITIPRPTPYYPKGPDGEYLPLTPLAIEALVRTGLTDTIPPELAAKMQAAGTLPAARPPRSPGATASDATSPPTPASTLALITSSPWTGWIVAAVVIVAAALYLRRQRAKRG